MARIVLQRPAACEDDSCSARELLRQCGLGNESTAPPAPALRRSRARVRTDPWNRIMPQRIAVLCMYFVAAAAVAQGDPRLTIDGGGIDILAVAGDGGTNAAPLLLRFVAQAPGRANDGALSVVAGSTASQCASAKSVAIHPSGRFVYLTSDATAIGRVCGYRFDPLTLSLTPVQGSPFLAGRGTRAIAVDPKGKFVYAVNYDDGSISGYSIDTQTGELRTLAGSAFVSGDDSTLALVVDPLGRFVYSTNGVSGGTISGFALDRDNGGLTSVPLAPVLAPGVTGPLAIDPRGRFLVVAGTSNKVYAIDAGNGKLTAGAGSFGPPAQGIAIDPSGRYLYTTSGDDRINAYRLDASGIPTAVGAAVATGRDPRGVAVDATGRHVYVANHGDGTISAYRIDDATGALSALAGSPFAATAGATQVATAGSLSTNETWQAGEPVARPVVAYGGRPPYLWNVTGTAPPGMSLQPDLRALTGTPTAAGAYDFLVRVIDAFGGFASRSFTFNVKSDAAPAGTASVIEYYNAALDHYFITWSPGEIAALDAGDAIKGWVRTGLAFNTYSSAQATTSPICRYYIPPALGNSHFFGRGEAECAATGNANPTFLLEDAAFMHMILPSAGSCAAGTTPVYRVFSNRPDANHRYTTQRGVRDAMAAKGWLAEGDGADLVVMCAP
jgi:6-phosphogluconolactonase (cycloisomerase 2 family)